MDLTLAHNKIFNALNDVVKAYEFSLPLLKNMRETCCQNDSVDVKFVKKCYEIIHSNEKLISWHRSILEESVTITLKMSKIDEETIYDENCNPENITNVEESKIKQKNVSNKPLVKAEKLVSTNENVILPNLTKLRKAPRTSISKNSRSSSRSSVREVEENQTSICTSDVSVATKSQLSSEAVQNIRDGNVKCTQMPHNQFKGFCVFCEEMKIFTKILWMQHFVYHTGEHFYFCQKCDVEFSTLSDHNTCPPNEIQNIFQRNNITDDRIAAFVCSICNYVQVSEFRLIAHLQNYHSISDDLQKCYKQI